MLATERELRLDDIYVRAGLSGPESVADYWIQFTEMPDAEVLADLQALPVDVEVQYGAPASARELAALAAALTGAAADHPDVIHSAGTRYDPQSYEFRLEYAAVDGATDDEVAQVLDAGLADAAQGRPYQRLPVGVVLDRDDSREPSVTEATVQGGRNLFRGGSRSCTAGFTARRHGNRGALTARHCPNRLEYRNRRGIISRNPAQTSYNAVDLQFHRTLRRHSTNRQFRHSRNDDRTVRRVANAPDGSAICHWGGTTGRSCTYVVNQDTCEVLSGHRYCGLDVTRDDVSAGGDSGGPWFLGTTARGTHSGGNAGNASFFTRVGRLYFLDAHILQR
ncbi:S1 family peptidase [Solicola gregarius]|uniref:S1 family peptidase n=1 Tax=Solicola gregarius TaxID=2908642 RepID=A0AA46TJI4_9ACTN|nr:S1 family peptidase [Solicola gregarius]UYM05633.1 S1 family peptidase [Solicola gregarius]